jgi:AraC-like DNA-binding protein
MSYMNIPYVLGKAPITFPQFISIWKVQANDAYNIINREGFVVPGLFITYEGKGILSQGNNRHELQAGTFFFVQEAIVTEYRCQDDNWKFYYLDFSSLDMIRNLQLPVSTVETTGKVAEAVLLCERMIDTLIAESFGYAYSANIILQQLLVLLARENESSPTLRQTELDNILIYIHRNMDKGIRVEELIERSGLSRTAFFSRFRALTGQSPSEYMLNLKLESAKVSLETTSLTVKEIASHLQFYDEFHFSKLFKRKYGQSPSTWRSSR